MSTFIKGVKKTKSNINSNDSISLFGLAELVINAGSTDKKVTVKELQNSITNEKQLVVEGIVFHSVSEQRQSKEQLQTIVDVMQKNLSIAKNKGLDKVININTGKETDIHVYSDVLLNNLTKLNKLNATGLNDSVSYLYSIKVPQIEKLLTLRTSKSIVQQYESSNGQIFDILPSEAVKITILDKYANNEIEAYKFDKAIVEQIEKMVNNEIVSSDVK